MKTLNHLLLFALSIFSWQSQAQNYSPPRDKDTPKFDGKAKLIRGPYLQLASDTGMMIRWRTDAATRSSVRYGLKPDQLDQQVNELDLVREHKISLTGLNPDTRYYYAIGTLKDTLAIGADQYFSTLPSAGQVGKYRIGVFGDCGALSVNQAKVRDEFLKYLGPKDLNAWILLGDNAYNDGTDMEYQAKFFNIYKDRLLKNYPVFPAPGNHDYHDVDFGSEFAQNNHNTAYYQNFTMPVEAESGGVPSHNPAYYSFNIGNVHFLSLDSYGKEEDQYFLYDTLSSQVKWVREDLKQNKNRDWVVAFWHYPPYSMGTHNSDTDGIMTKIRENFISILEQQGVDLIICGHSHVYERSKLMKGHYGLEASFDPKKHNLSNSSGYVDNKGKSDPYIKKSVSAPGTVYVVSGSASYVGKPEASWPHDAMFYSNATDPGAAMIEVEGKRLDFKWVCGDGVIRDQFTVMKK